MSNHSLSHRLIVLTAMWVVFKVWQDQLVRVTCKNVIKIKKNEKLIMKTFYCFKFLVFLYCIGGSLYQLWLLCYIFIHLLWYIQLLLLCIRINNTVLFMDWLTSSSKFIFKTSELETAIISFSPAFNSISPPWLFDLFQNPFMLVC